MESDMERKERAHIWTGVPHWSLRWRALVFLLTCITGAKAKPWPK